VVSISQTHLEATYLFSDGVCEYAENSTSSVQYILSANWLFASFHGEGAAPTGNIPTRFHELIIIISTESFITIKRYVSNKEKGIS
jgi:hypothetical protein